MVQDTGKALHAGTFKPLNLPGPIVVEGDLQRLAEWDRQTIAAVEDNRHLDYEWRCSEPLFRICFTVLLTSGQRL